MSAMGSWRSIKEAKKAKARKSRCGARAAVEMTPMTATASVAVVSHQKGHARPYPGAIPLNWTELGWGGWTYFERQPRRKYLIRQSGIEQWAIIRRCQPILFMKVNVGAQIEYLNTDRCLRGLWLEAAWPDLDPPAKGRLYSAIKKADEAWQLAKEKVRP
jgi:hypothetical protein